MTSIGPLNGVFSAGAITGAGADSRQVAQATIREVGHRVLAWVEAAGGGRGGADAWAAEANVPSDFRTDATELARGGDIYGLGELARTVTERFAGTPAEEGELHRSLETFTREAVVQLAGLAGAPADRQLAGICEALASAADASSGDGAGGVAQRLDAASAVLAQQNGR